ncbi:MAG: hypothetical protein Kow00121_56010 [Elainellaceae cyanobacterium]
MTDSQPDFSALTSEGGSFSVQQATFTVHTLPDRNSGYRDYELRLEDCCIGKATGQPSSLILTTIAKAGTAAPTLDPLIIRLYGGRCHWIETLQILPEFRGRGYGSLWLESLCAVLQSEVKLPIALLPDEWWDQSNPIPGTALEDWYERHGFLPFPEAETLFKLRVRDDPNRAATAVLIQQMVEEINSDISGMLGKMILDQ